MIPLGERGGGNFFVIVLPKKTKKCHPSLTKSDLRYMLCQADLDLSCQVFFEGGGKIN